MPFAPDWVSPPGDSILDIIEEREWTQVELAQRLGFSLKHVNQLIKGKVPLTEDAAIRLERVLGSTVGFWLAREARYRERCARLEAAGKHAGWTDEGVRKLKDLKNLKSLFLGQRLSYKGPPSPSDETIPILVEMKSLESLQLEETRLSLASLRQLKQLPNLKKLTLGGIDIPQADVEQLRKELRGVEVKWTPPSDVYQKRIKALFGEK